MNTDRTKSAAEWLANLDMTAILQHLEDCRRQDEEDAAEEPAHAAPMATYWDGSAPVVRYEPALFDRSEL